MAPFRFFYRWTIWAPIAAWVMLGAAYVLPPHPAFVGLMVVALGATVFAAVHHAEVVAHRVGEPFGTLVLAIAVTIIEVSLIVSMMLGPGTGTAGLARDTIYAAVMIVCNGIVGTCLLVGGIHHHEQRFEVRGAAASLAVLAALSVLTLVMPNYTSLQLGPMLSPPQLAFAGVSSLVLYGVFVFVQTVRHREYFLAEAETGGEDMHAALPSGRVALASSVLLVVSLVAVVLLAKLLSPTVEAAVSGAGLPQAIVGIVIAALVLLPEALAAVRAARHNRLQTSLNLALGSALASIGLTIPAVAAVSLITHVPLALGIDGRDTVMLALTLLVVTITLGVGRTTILQGAVHLFLFATYVFLSLVP
jgi:Ca2+:H+ antiporter